MAAKTRHKKWEVKIQHCPISSKLDMWVDNDVLTLKNFYQSPFSKWPPQYRKNSTLSDIIQMLYKCMWIDAELENDCNISQGSRRFPYLVLFPVFDFISH